MNVRRAFAIGLGILLLSPVVVAVAPTAAAAECLSVSGGGLSYGTTYTLRVSNSCASTVYARYNFIDGTNGFTSGHSGFVSIDGGYGQQIAVNLSSVAAGTRSPNIQFFEQGPYYGTPTFFLPSYTIAGSTTSLPTRPQYTPVPAPVVPRFPACSSVQHPSPAIGKQISADLAEYTWTAVPGISSYTVSEGQWDGKTWTKSTWKSVGAATSHKIAFAPGSRSVTIWVASECSGTFTVDGTQSVGKGVGTVEMPALGLAQWTCVGPIAEKIECSKFLAFNKKQSKNVSQLVAAALSQATIDFSAAGVQPTQAVEVVAKRYKSGVTLLMNAQFTLKRVFL